MEIQEFVSGRPKQHVILGGDFNASLYGMTDFFHVGESIPRPRTLVDTNDSLRARALHTTVTELDLTVTNTWMNADTEQELFTLSSWSNLADSLTQMDSIMTSRNLEMKHVQILDSDWFQTDHRAVLAVLSLNTSMRYTLRNGMNLRGWEPDEAWHTMAAETLTDCENWNAMVPLLMETAMAHRKMETKEMSVTEMELKSLLLKKKKTGRHLERTELKFVLPSNLEKAESAEARETPEQDQGECRDGESTQENAKQEFQLELDSKARKHRICSHKFLPRTLLDSNKPRRSNPIREATLGRAVEKPESGLCRRDVGLTKETGKGLEEIEKRERFTGSNHSRRFESIAPGLFEKTGEIGVSDVLGDMTFAEDWLCSMTVKAPKVVGATSLAKFKPIAGLCGMRKFLSFVLHFGTRVCRRCLCRRRTLMLVCFCC